jgi:hypothetical protein
MSGFSKALTLAVLASLALVCFPSLGSADAIMALQQDDGAIVTVATGGSLSSLTFSGIFGDFILSNLRSVADNGITLSDLLSSAMKVVNNSTESHVLRMWFSSHRTEGNYSLTTVSSFTFSAGGSPNVSGPQNPTSVPEPDGLLLLGCGLVGLVMATHRTSVSMKV